MTTEHKPKTVKPSRSVPIRFIGRVIAETEWTTRHDSWMRFTVYETRGGAYIAVTEGSVPGKPDHIDRTATVVEPIYDEAGQFGDIDAVAMQIAVLEHYEFHDRAKQMLKNELGWSPFVTVE